MKSTCNLCGSTKFVDLKTRRLAKCKSCNSLERTRLLWMHLLAANIAPQARILHCAPEKGLYRALSQYRPEAQYEPADLDPARYDFAAGIRQIDLCDLDGEPSDHYDLIIHSHVLEHVPCTMAYTLKHLSRMLKPDGLQICVIPFAPGYFDETFANIGAEERTRRFGQHDHVRRIGAEDRHVHVGKIIRLPEHYDAEARFGAKALLRANIPRSMWQGFSISTVLELRKSDYLL